MAEESNGAEQAPTASEPASAASAPTAFEPSTPAPAIPTPSGKRPKRGVIVAAVIAAVVVVAGIGAWVWHEQPSFCNALCHSPMDAYVESYGTADPGLGIMAHAAAGNTCLSCHEAEFTTQVSEAMAWVSDSYPVAEDGTLATGKEFASQEFCARSGCHGMDEIVANTWGFEGNDEKYNPHASHQYSALECGDCHKVHEKSTLMCNECHALAMPEGWEAPHE